MVFLEDAWGIHLECHQFHRPFSISVNLLISVSNKVLFFQGDCWLQFIAELELEPLPAIHGRSRTDNGVRTDFRDSHLLRWLSLTSQSQSHITTDYQSVSASSFRAPFGAHDHMLITVWQLLFCRNLAPPLTRGRVWTADLKENTSTEQTAKKTRVFTLLR
jgi:hypothetical protein